MPLPDISPEGHVPVPPTRATRPGHEQADISIVALSPTEMVLRMDGDGQELPVERKFSLHVDLAALGGFRVTGRARPWENQPRHYVFRFSGPSYRFLRAAAEHVVAKSPDATPSALRKSGLPISSLDHTIEVTEFESDEDMGDVLVLRRLVAAEEGRVDADVSLDDMRDRYDRHSRHICFKIQGRLVGCMRIVYIEGKRSQSELEEYISLPDGFLAANSCEVSRFVVHPDYRGGYVFIHLIRNVVRFAHRNNMDYVLIDCREFLLNTYRRIGADDTGLTINLPLYPGEDMHVMYFDTKRQYSEFFLGNLVHWSKVMLPVYQELVRDGFVEAAPLFRLKMLTGRGIVLACDLVDRAAWQRQRRRVNAAGNSRLSRA